MFTNSVISAYVELGDFWLEMSVLSLIVKVGFDDNLLVSNSLIIVCLRMGEINFTRKVFNGIGKRVIIT